MRSRLRTRRGGAGVLGVAGGGAAAAHAAATVAAAAAAVNLALNSPPFHAYAIAKATVAAIAAAAAAAAAAFRRFRRDDPDVVGA